MQSSDEEKQVYLKLSSALAYRLTLQASAFSNPEKKILIKKTAKVGVDPLSE
jgi:hypothetical protein